MHAEFAHVREYADVVAEAKRSKEEIHIGRVFGFVVVKNSEQSEEKQKLKGRCVFQGNNVNVHVLIGPDEPVEINLLERLIQNRSSFTNIY